MKVILVVATSQDGFITRDDDPNPSSWTSAEDQKLYKEIKSKHKLLVFGKNTHDAQKKSPDPAHLTVILTNQPEKYADQAVPDVLEFAKLTPQEFVNKYQNEFESCLVLGGSYVYTSFLESGLINEIFMTVEPQIHTTGIPFIVGGRKLGEIVELPKPEITKLNDTGTILKHYVFRKITRVKRL